MKFGVHCRFLCDRWCSHGQNIEAKAKATNLIAKAKANAKAWTFEVKAFKHDAIVELKIRNTSDCIAGQVVN